MRKQIKFLFVLLFIGLFFGSVNSFTSNEEGKIIRMVEGASIRKKTETSSQGLRFYAILDEGAKNNEHGFYLAYGKADVSMLEQALLDNANNPVINGKAVYKVLVPGSDADNQYSVVLTGIPEDGYFDNISVFSYVIVEDEVFISDPFTRSIANVALKLANAGESIDYIENVDTIINTEHKHVNIKPNGDIEIITGIYELDHENLRKEFVNDWAQMFGYFISGYDHEGFYLQAKEGSNDELITNKNLSSTNIYKFFNDELLKSKWGWLLDYIIANCEIVLPSMQANAIKGDGTASGNLLFNSYHLSYSIINFFSQSHEEGDYTAIDFTDADRYATIKDYNHGVFVNLNDEVLYRSGQEITLPQPLNRKGYNFQHYLKDSETLSVGHSLVISGDEVIKAIYTPINYALKFYDGNVSLNNLNRTYTILDSFVLPEAEKDNHVFLGWYDNIDLEGEQVLKIEKGNTNEIVLYASWRTENVYSITYNLNGGAFNETPTSSFTINDEVILPVPIRDDYDFIGWYETENFTSNVVTKISIGSVNNKTYYAKWEKVSLPPSDKDFVMDAYNALDITFASGDSENSVTKNLTLPTSSIHGTTVTWNTSNSAAISAAGVVVRGNNDVVVTLTATIKLNAATEEKVFTLTVLKIEQVDPNAEYNITFNLNGGTWPKTPDIPGYTNRTTMITDFLTDFYNFVNPSGVSKNDFIHGVGKTSGFDGLYGGETSPYFERLYAANSKEVNPASDKFINQPQYNKWVPLLDLMEEYTALGEQGFWASPWTGQRRIVPFIQEAKPAGAWNHIPIEDVKAITGKIPEALKVATPGVQITVPSKYKATDNDITLPEPTKTGDTFVGWYDNADLWGDKVTKITKGSMGNKVYYARYSSSVVVDPNLTDSEKLTLAKDDLKITYASGDSATKVTKNITLKTSGLHGATITWSSSDVSVISNSGTVTRKESGDITITLTATIKIGSLTETKVFTLKVLQKELEPEFYTIEFVNNGGSFVVSGFKNKTELATAFLTDLHAFVKPTDNLTTFMHGAGKTSGFNGTWYTNDDYKAKIYSAGVKSGNNNFFLSHSTYQAKWKPVADFMVSFVKVGNPDQDFWASPYTGNMRLWQYFTDVKPGTAWSDEEMAKMPTGLTATVIPSKYDKDTPTITLPLITKSGHEFGGWYETATFTGSKVTSIPKGSTGNKKFYAKWEEVTRFTITYNLNSGSFAGYTSKTALANAFLEDLYEFIKPSESLTVFKHGAGQTSGFKGTWYSNEDHRNKIYGANIKTGNNNYFLSHSTYQAKWKPFADFMITFVKVGNPDQDFWSSPYTGIMRIWQYLTNVKPSSAWSDAEMSKLPTGLSANVYYEYNVDTPTITLPTPTRSGYTFEGWYTANTGGTKVTNIPKGSTGNKVFYARWKEVANQDLVALMNLLKGGHKATLNKHNITYYGGTTSTRAQYMLVNRFLFEKLTINTTSYWLPTSRINHPNATATKHWVTIHDTGNINATAASNASYMMTVNTYLSWHYTTGNDGIYQSMNETMRAYHAGDGSVTTAFTNTGISATNPYLRPKMTIVGGYFAINGTKTSVKAPGTASQLPETGLHPVIISGKYHIPNTRLSKTQVAAGRISYNGGNYNSIGIESSVKSTDHLWWTWAKTAKLTADILVRRGLLPDRVVFHNTFDGKMCPQTAIRNGHINEWLEMIYLEYKIRKDYSNYTITFTSNNTNILNNVGRITTFPSSTTNVSYKITLKAPNGNTLSETLTTSVRA